MKISEKLLEKRKIGPFVMDGSEIIAFSAVLIVLLASFIFRQYGGFIIVKGASMEPTYHNMDVCLTTTKKNEETLKKDAIVIFKSKDTLYRDYIKRIVALPGDAVQVKDGVLFVNGKEQKYGYEKIENAGLAANEIRLEEDEYFVLGDNRNHSNDSRFLGPINKSQIRRIVTKKLFNLRF